MAQRHHRATIAEVGADVDAMPVAEDVEPEASTAPEDAVAVAVIATAPEDT